MKDKVEVVEKAPRTLSMGILERFYSAKQIADLMAEYNGHKKRTSRGTNRATNLDEPITDFEKMAMDHYFNSTDVPMVEFATEAKKPLSECLSATNRGCRKIVWANLTTYAQDWK